MTNREKLKKMVYASLFLAIAMVLPFLTGQIPQIGKALCPMHIPVLLCGFFCGPLYGALVGFMAPYLRFVLFGMPIIMPTGIGMSFELLSYGLFSGLFYQILPNKKWSIYVSLVSAMIIGRAVWGIVRVVLFSLGQSAFGWTAFLAGAFLNAIPGIIVQLVLIPILVMVLQKNK